MLPVIPEFDRSYSFRKDERNMTELAIGDTAPNFTLPGNGGSNVSLSAYAGRKVVLYFYPKDDTPGCTLEAQEFSAHADAFAKAGAVVIGMSPDTARKHDNFCKKHSLNIILASDTTSQILSAYGVWVEKSMYGRKYMGVERSTVLIDEAGRIAAIWRKVKPEGHAAEVLEAVKALQ
ncbi:MAG: thioredoxin-dependent thiol peroxidase [Pseudomonadota bacterium]